MSCQVLDEKSKKIALADLEEIISFVNNDNACEMSSGGYKKNRKRGGAGADEGKVDKCKFIQFLEAIKPKRGVKVVPELRTAIAPFLSTEEQKISDNDLHTVFQVLMATVPVTLSAIKVPINKEFQEMIFEKHLDQLPASDALKKRKRGYVVEIVTKYFELLEKYKGIVECFILTQTGSHIGLGIIMYHDRCFMSGRDFKLSRPYRKLDFLEIVDGTMRNQSEYGREVTDSFMSEFIDGIGESALDIVFKNQTCFNLGYRLSKRMLKKAIEDFNAIKYENYTLKPIRKTYTGRPFIISAAYAQEINPNIIEAIPFHANLDRLQVDNPLLTTLLSQNDIGIIMKAVKQSYTEEENSKYTRTGESTRDPIGVVVTNYVNYMNLVGIEAFSTKMTDEEKTAAVKQIIRDQKYDDICTKTIQEREAIYNRMFPPQQDAGSVNFYKTTERFLYKAKNRIVWKKSKRKNAASFIQLKGSYVNIKTLK